MMSVAHPIGRRVGALAGMILTVTTLVAGCAPPVGVRRVDARRVHRSLTSNVLTTGELSTPTTIRLDQRDLVGTFEESPGDVLARLQAEVVAGRVTSDDLFALAEASFHHAEDTADRRHYLAAALYAYAFLFPEPPGTPPDPFDPRLRQASDIYNRGITSGLATSDRSEVEVRTASYWLPFGVLDVSVDEGELEWGDRKLVHFAPVAELEVRGLRHRHRAPGIGAPVAAGTEPLERGQPMQAFVPPLVKVPATLLLRIDDPLRQIAAGRVQSRLEVYPASTRERVSIAGRDVPLELEPTASLAATLAEAPLWERELKGFFSDVIASQKLTRLAAAQPYQPGRIPIVLVHGTASSVGRWADMVNDLENDAEIRAHYQFWLFQYDTGNPIAYSALLLRRSLAETVARFDPDGRDPALRQMVVIGHSQGGLLTKMTAIASGDRLWQRLSTKPLDELDLDDEDRELLREALFIEPLPFVRRVIFIATPHRGSYLASFGIADWITSFVRFPAEVARAGNNLLSRNPEVVRVASGSRLPTSVTNMTPGNPFIQALASIPVAPEVTAHSIIPVAGDGPIADGDDGVVAYGSAHVDGVASELVVRDVHSCQANPRVIAEVRRILLENAAAAAPARGDRRAETVAARDE